MRRFMECCRWTCWLGVAGCLADWRPPATEGFDHERWFAWTPADPGQSDGPGQAWRWTVPDGVDRVVLSAWGAGGGGSVALPGDGVVLGFAGGAGGFGLVEVAVEPGGSLLIVPGRGGDAGGSHGAGVWTAPPRGQRWLGGGGPGAPVVAPILPPREEGAAEADAVRDCFPLDADAGRWCTGAGAGGGWSGVFTGVDLDAVGVEAALLVVGGGGGAGAGGPGGAGGGVEAEDAPGCGADGASFAGTRGGPAAPGGGGVRALTFDEDMPPGGFGAALRGGSGGYATPHVGLSVGGGGVRGGGGGGGGWFGGGGGANLVGGQPGCGGGGGSGWTAGAEGRLATGAGPTVPGEAGAVWGAGGAPGGRGGPGGVRIQW